MGGFPLARSDRSATWNVPRTLGRCPGHVKPPSGVRGKMGVL
jgi:hypothetical protein